MTLSFLLLSCGWRYWHLSPKMVFLAKKHIYGLPQDRCLHGHNRQIHAGLATLMHLFLENFTVKGLGPGSIVQEW